MVKIPVEMTHGRYWPPGESVCDTTSLRLRLKCLLFLLRSYPILSVHSSVTTNKSVLHLGPNKQNYRIHQQQCGVTEVFSVSYHIKTYVFLLDRIQYSLQQPKLTCGYRQSFPSFFYFFSYQTHFSPNSLSALFLLFSYTPVNSDIQQSPCVLYRPLKDHMEIQDIKALY